MNSCKEEDVNITYPFTEDQTFYNGRHYIIEFFLPDKSPIRLFSDSKASLVEMANLLYEKKQNNNY